MPFTKFRKEYKRIPWKTGKLICFWGTSFPRVSLMRIPMETYSACDFPRVWTSAPHPLWAHPCCLRVAESTHFTCILVVRWSQVSFHGLAGQKKSSPWRLVLVLESSQTAHNQMIQMTGALREQWIQMTGALSEDYRPYRLYHTG